VIGYLYNFVYHDTVLAYQSGLAYDADARLKPGWWRIACASTSTCGRARGAYDFMAGEARYKASLGEPGRRCFILLLQRPTGALRVEFGSGTSSAIWAWPGRRVAAAGGG